VNDTVETIPKGDLERLIAAIDPRATLVTARALNGGVGNAMTVIEVARDAHRTERFVVRRPPEWALREDPNILANEFALLRRLRSIGIRCQTPRLFDDSAADAPYLVVEYIDGSPEFAAPPSRAYIEQYAQALADIHRVDASGFGLADNASTVERWWLRKRERFDESLQERRIVEALTAAWPWRPANDPTLLHGDYWPGNVLWKDGRLVGVIDWEEARRGDPLFDVAISRLELAWAFGAESMQRFTDAYRAAARVDVATLPYWDLLAALRPAHHVSRWAATWPGFDRADVTAATMRTAHRAFVAQAFTALEARR
jgi:aminoglycoside phosphotransferase (APT) family kinase protein